MRILLLIFFFVVFIQSYAQNHIDDMYLGSVYEELISEFEECIENRKQDCHILANKIVEKGKQENVNFLDYLYFKKALYFWELGELDSVIMYAQLTLENPNPIKKQRLDSEAYNILGNCFYYRGELETAINYYLKNAAILEKDDNQLYLGYAYSNIATLFGVINNNDKQLEYLHKSFKLLKSNHDERFIATVASNIALAYYKTQDTLKIINWSKKAIELSEHSNDLVARTQSYITLSMLEKDPIKTEKLAEKAVRFADELNDKAQQAKAYYIYAAALNNIGKKVEAIKYIDQAVSLAQKIQDNSTLIKASSIAAKIYYDLGDKEKSADFYHTYEFLKDSVYSIENASKINEINTKYETEKKEKQIAEQNLKIQKQQSNLLLTILGGALLISVLGGTFVYHRKKQQLRLKQLQQEKENAILNSFILGEERERARISHELHDSVAAMIGAAKMSLESIPHLPQQKQFEQLTKVERILERSHADIRHIAHNLLPTVLDKEGLIQATKHFISEINEAKLVNFSVIDNNSKAEEQSKQLQLMLFRIIQELVNNIIKHSQAQNAEIIFNKFHKNLQIEIIDDGIGYDDKINQEHQGLYSIAQRLKAVGGSFIISKKNKSGTQVKVELMV